MVKKKKGMALEIIIILVLLVILVTFIGRDADYSKSALEEFCSNECGEKDLIYFNNNSDYNYLECECVIGKIEPRGYTQNAGVETVTNYYDSQTLKEITEEEVEERLNEKR